MNTFSSPLGPSGLPPPPQPAVRTGAPNFHERFTFDPGEAGHQSPTNTGPSRVTRSSDDVTPVGIPPPPPTPRERTPARLQNAAAKRFRDAFPKKAPTQRRSLSLQVLGEEGINYYRENYMLHEPPETAVRTLPPVYPIVVLKEGHARQLEGAPNGQVAGDERAKRKRERKELRRLLRMEDRLKKGLSEADPDYMASSSSDDSDDDRDDAAHAIAAVEGRYEKLRHNVGRAIAARKAEEEKKAAARKAAEAKKAAAMKAAEEKNAAARQEERKRKATEKAAAAEALRLATEKKEAEMAAAIALAEVEDEDFSDRNAKSPAEDAHSPDQTSPLTASGWERRSTLERLRRGEWIVMFPPDTANPRQYKRMFFPDEYNTSTDSSSEESESESESVSSEDGGAASGYESGGTATDDDELIASFASSALGSAIGGAVRMLAPIMLQRGTAQEEMAASSGDEAASNAKRTFDRLHQRRRVADPPPRSDTDTAASFGRGERFMSPEEFETTAWHRPPAQPPVRRDPMRRRYLWGIAFFAFWYVLGYSHRDRQDYVHGPGIDPWEHVPRALLDNAGGTGGTGNERSRRWRMSSAAGQVMEEKFSSGN